MVSVNVEFSKLKNPVGPIVRYWFERDSETGLWIGRVTENGIEVCVVLSPTEKEVVESTEREYRNFMRNAPSSTGNTDLPRLQPDADAPLGVPR